MKRFLLAAVFLSFAINLLAVQPGDLDPSFQPAVGNVTGANCVAIQSNGAILVGGGFGSVNGVIRYGLARLNPDVTLDLGFVSNFEYYSGVANVNAVVPLSSGRILVNATSDVQVNETNVPNGLLRLNSDGSLDPTWNTAQLNLNAGPFGVAPDGSIFLSGNINNNYGLHHLSADGALDAAYAPTTDNNGIQTLAIQADGKLVIAGSFTKVNGVARQYIARLLADGTLDTAFDPGTSANQPINALALNLGGKIVIGGSFSTVDGTGRNQVAQLNADGTLDTTFVSPNGSSSIQQLITQPDGKVLVGALYYGVSDNYESIYRLNANGSADSTWSVTRSPSYPVNYALTGNGSVLVASPFLSYAGSPVYGATRLNSTGQIDTSFLPVCAIPTEVDQLVVQTDGKLVVAGRFNVAGGAFRNNIARFKTNLGLDASFDPGTGADDSIVHMTADSSGRFDITGNFSHYNGSTRQGIARVNSDGSLDSTFVPSSGFYAQVFSLATQADGALLIGGNFSYNNNGSSGIGRLSNAGAVDSTFSAAANGSVNSMLVLSSGTIIAGGSFTTLSGASVNYLGAVNSTGAPVTAFNANIGSGADSTIYRLALDKDGKILVFGNFSNFNGVAASGSVRLNADGTRDTSYTGANTFTQTAVLPQSDGKTVVFGSYSSAPNTFTSPLRLNADGSYDSTFGMRQNLSAATGAIDLSKNIILGGNFALVDGKPRTNLARLIGQAPGTFKFSASTYSGAEGGAPVTVTVSRTQGSGGAVAVNYATGGGSATAGSDYTSASGTLNWADGDAADKTFQVTIIDDTDYDPNETIGLTLSSPTGGAALGTPSQATITIIDDDPPTTPTPTPTATPTPSASPTPTPTPPPGGSPTPTPTPPPGGSPTPTPTPPPGGSPTPTPTPNPKFTPTPTPTPSPTPAPTATPAPTPTPVPTLTQPTVAFTSPPAGITLDAGGNLPIAATVTDPSQALADVKFYLNNALVADLPAAGPFVYNTVAPAAGDYTLQAIATDSQGRQSTSTQPVHVEAADDSTPAPSSLIVTDLNKRYILSGVVLPVTATITDVATDDAIARVDFYADGVIYQSMDGAGNVLTSAAGAAPVRRDAATPAPRGSTFTAPFTVPGADRLVNLVTVALSKLGKQQASPVVSFHAVQTTADHPPAVRLNGPADRSRVRVGVDTAVPVDASDPDAGAPRATRKPRPRDIYTPSGVIAKMEYYLNALKLKDAAETPYGYTFNPPSAGEYVLSVIATDASGLSTVSQPTRVEAFVPPNVNVSLKGSAITQEGGAKVKIVLTRDGTDLTDPVTVFFKLKGSAVNGVDYATVATSAIIPAGSATVKVKIKPLDDSLVNGPRALKLKLVDSPDGSYNVGAMKKANITIEDND